MKTNSNKILTTLIALVWLVNGLFCKVLHLVPRHEMIVSRILGFVYAPFLTKLIGISEILICIWIMSNIKSRWCAITQIILVATMNIIEYNFAQDLLLFGKLNLVFASLFILVVYYNEFILNAYSHSKK
ncbi:MAG: DoxX-like family protein [Saprospirales bacterium]|nr:DoxX-like family protein [Saprospirales bacterium]